MYAHAAAQIRDLSISTAGRSDAEVEGEIRAQLETMGFLNPQVSFQRSADGAEMRLEAKDPEGHLIIAEARHKTEGGSGGPEPNLDIMMIDPQELKGKSDAEIQAIVERKLAERGITDAQVTVQNGQVKVEAKREVRQ